MDRLLVDRFKYCALWLIWVIMAALFVWFVVLGGTLPKIVGPEPAVYRWQETIAGKTTKHCIIIYPGAGENPARRVQCSDVSDEEYNKYHLYWRRALSEPK